MSDQDEGAQAPDTTEGGDVVQGDKNVEVPAEPAGDDGGDGGDE